MQNRKQLRAGRGGPLGIKQPEIDASDCRSGAREPGTHIREAVDCGQPRSQIEAGARDASRNGQQGTAVGAVSGMCKAGFGSIEVRLRFLDLCRTMLLVGELERCLACFKMVLARAKIDEKLGLKGR